ncbi:hypothetical protein [Belliella pelovolcani]|uniref:Uncharacterized protein n=1 Tax=Belliella pelovolcani TaxID=529505 RepID=A0A1N7PS66_9BACT|nr:hypothetical protein [Belliella pelovolcani]SIT13503.1 hypothetical protein SAMN05421761_12011 [Belliella pelovolcani]
METIHRGKILKSIVKAHAKTGSKIASDAGYKDGTIYKHFQKQDLPFEIIMKYGIAMNHDVSIEFPEIINEPSYPNFKNKLNSLNSIKSDNIENEWKEKYHTLLEKHHEILLTNISLKERISELEKLLKQ